MNLADREDRTVACAEYVLGTLTGAEREAFTAQLAQDRELQAEVGYWQDRMLGLACRVPPVEPADTVWERIEAQVRTESRTVPQTGSSAAPSRPGSTSSRAPTSRPFWERVAFWRTFSGFALAASVLLALLLVLRPPAPSLTYVAVLQSADLRAGWLVQATDSGPVKLVPLVDPGRIPAGKSWQFWTKGKNAAAPTSLGLLPGADAFEVPRRQMPDLGDEQLFEITLEPEAGSPTGRPTGPVLFVGKAKLI